MTNMPRNRLRALGELPPEPPGGHIIIGQKPQAPPQQQMTLMQLTGMICNDMVGWPSFRDEHAHLTAQVNADPKGPSPEALYALALMDAMAAAQDAVKAIVEAEKARREIPAIPQLDVPPAMNGHAPD